MKDKNVSQNEHVRKRTSILVVEDHDINQELMREMLARFNCSVKMAKNGVEGVSEAKADKYDMIFMDLQMPVMGGIEATRKIREDEKGKESTPIIALTANAMDSDRKDCKEAGMNGYLSKPFEFKDIEGILDQFMQ